MEITAKGTKDQPTRRQTAARSEGPSAVLPSQVARPPMQLMVA